MLKGQCTSIVYLSNIIFKFITLSKTNRKLSDKLSDNIHIMICGSKWSHASLCCMLATEYLWTSTYECITVSNPLLMFRSALSTYCISNAFAHCMPRKTLLNLIIAQCCPWPAILTCMIVILKQAVNLNGFALHTAPKVAQSEQFIMPSYAFSRTGYGFVASCYSVNSL